MIALACDHGGYALMQEVKVYLENRGLAYKCFGTNSADSCDYPDFAAPAARAIVNGECARGIFICGTGIGMAIAANKIPGIRAAVCGDCFSAEMTRLHNNANVVSIGARVTGAGLALMIIERFLDTVFEGGERHERRIGMLYELEN